MWSIPVILITDIEYYRLIDLEVYKKVIKTVHRNFKTKKENYIL